jgi:hypothetical protein
MGAKKLEEKIIPAKLYFDLLFHPEYRDVMRMDGHSLKYC